MPLCAKAYAKINLNLIITGKRNDGYHLLKTVMQSVDLCDNLYFKKAKSGITLNCDNKLLQNNSNLVYIAAKTFFEKTGIPQGVIIDLQKNIPLKSGLGGGSSDAAATLIALNKMYGSPLNYDGIKNIAATLGADVPFFIKGGTVLCEGIGEITAKLPYLGDYFCLLVNCGQKSSTKDMYELIDRHLQNADIDINSDNLLRQNAYNSFLQALDYKNTVQAVMTVLNDCGAAASGLSGSGPTVYGLFKNKADFNAASKILSNDYKTCACNTSPVSVVISE